MISPYVYVGIDDISSDIELIKILGKVAEYYKVEHSDIVSQPRRRGEVKKNRINMIKARATYCVLSKKHTSKSLSHIGRLINISAGNVSYHIKNNSNEYSADKDVLNAIKYIVI